MVVTCAALPAMTQPQPAPWFTQLRLRSLPWVAKQDAGTRRDGDKSWAGSETFLSTWCGCYRTAAARLETVCHTLQGTLHPSTETEPSRTMRSPCPAPQRTHQPPMPQLPSMLQGNKSTRRMLSGPNCGTCQEPQQVGAHDSHTHMTSREPKGTPRPPPPLLAPPSSPLVPLLHLHSYTNLSTSMLQERTVMGTCHASQRLLATAVAATEWNLSDCCSNNIAGQQLRRGPPVRCPATGCSKACCPLN